MSNYNVVVQKKETVIKSATFTVDADSEEKAQKLAAKMLKKKDTVGTFEWAEDSEESKKFAKTKRGARMKVVAVVNQT